ncbi:MAG: RNA-binding protein [Anaerolineales bacterium]|nr:RNA-binding protein [Anaerolineales bacterium]MDD5466954.1 RNA-binding protein [Anaerolineales bacterium]
MENRLFVGNLSRTTTQEDLKALFAKVGTVVAVEMITISDPGHPKQIAFIDMEDQVEAQRAVGMLNGSDLHGRTMRVNIARPREKLPDGGGWYTDPPPPSRRRKGAAPRKPS